MPRRATKQAAASAPAERGADALARYREKRDFAATPEPRGRGAAGRRGAPKKPAPARLRFCVQKHAARRLHYDLRLELDGVLLSWAVTRGPSLVPGEKRLAVHTEDHPLDYLTFEGLIPEGSYGGGAMIVWDEGTWEPEGDPAEGMRRGRLTFRLEGERLAGRWHLVRTGAGKERRASTKENWLLLKSDDEAARAAGDADILAEADTSVRSGRTIEDLKSEGVRRADWDEKQADPKAKPSARTTSSTKAKAARAAKEKPAADPRAALDPATVTGAKRGKLPPFVEPCLATLSEVAPTGEAWLHEIKFDGYRIQARIANGRATLLTRKGLDWTSKFEPLAHALSQIVPGSAVVDGEAVVEDTRGVSDFGALQAALKAGDTGCVVYHAFDLLHLDGVDLTGAPLAERKRLLALLLDDAPAGGAVRLSEHIPGNGEAMKRHACRIGLEGIVSKRADRPYRSGRGEDWRKTKCSARQEFVIAGYVPATNRRKAVGSLVLGVYEGTDLVHVGRVGTGFTEADAKALHDAIEAVHADAPPFAAPLPRAAAAKVRWARPALVAEIELRGWTADGLLRHASYKGLREDKDPREATREAPPADETSAAKKTRARTVAQDPYAGIRLTSPDRVLWEGQGITKQGLADYCAEIADWILPQIANRPLALIRCPAGSQKECFFAKHPWAGLDEAVLTPTIGDDAIVAIRDLRGLMSLVQFGTLEIHPWGSTLDDPERPDRLVFDLDPGEGVGFPEIVDAARTVRERLAADGLESVVKTTGGKGLHVVVPLVPKAGWDEAKAYAAGLAAAMAKDEPARFTDTLAKKARTGRIFVDYLRNGRGATAVAAYSTRARPGAPVATPLAWEELGPEIAPDHYSVTDIPIRLAHLTRDPWAGLDAVKQTLPKAKTSSKAKPRRKPG
ncbi:DNA ligase D [Salinarimonas ramus]|uniref:DNA ligase (ATP) n=1 Tax=Salinarimonas ramus TaxID=690164 RepID=A0A917QKA3_9HYPH|nr:DNA ligase D [Salinarimonas ramus]GGK53968.1 ATP-dependent DNA ligase [Salinarimonas ramus]